MPPLRIMIAQLLTRPAHLLLPVCMGLWNQIQSNLALASFIPKRTLYRAVTVQLPVLFKAPSTEVFLCL